MSIQEETFPDDFLDFDDITDEISITPENLKISIESGREKIYFLMVR
jgi:hypothetical protein